MNIKAFTRIAMLAAIACILTMFPQIKTVAGGYVHFGDSIIYITAALLGPIPAAIVGSLGHSLADLLSGSPIFILPTFIIKGFLGYAAGKVLYNRITAKPLALTAAIAFFIVVGGYFLTEIIIFGIDIAMVSLISSPIQWIMSIISTSILLPIFKKVFKSL